MLRCRSQSRAMSNSPVGSNAPWLISLSSPTYGANTPYPHRGLCPLWRVRPVACAARGAYGAWRGGHGLAVWLHGGCIWPMVVRRPVGCMWAVYRRMGVWACSSVGYVVWPVAYPPIACGLWWAVMACGDLWRPVVACGPSYNCVPIALN